MKKLSFRKVAEGEYKVTKPGDNVIIGHVVDGGFEGVFVSLYLEELEEISGFIKKKFHAPTN